MGDNKMLIRKAISDLSQHVDAISIQDNKNEASTKIVPIENVVCDCCGLNEECSFSYIKQVKDMHFGRWICGLCSEAVKERLIHSPTSSKMFMSDALSLHKDFCDEFIKTTRINPKLSLTCSLKGVAKRSLEQRTLSPKDDEKLPLPKLPRSNSCSPRIDVNIRGESIIN